MMANAIRSVWGNNSSVISSRDVRRTRVYSDSESEEEEEEGMSYFSIYAFQHTIIFSNNDP